MVRQIERQFTVMICKAAGVESSPLHLSSSEVIKYAGGNGMEWHFDNYAPNPDLGPALEPYGVINGALTLKGRADYYFKDPQSGETGRIEVGPGTLVLTRSGDLGNLRQIEHAVGPPWADQNGDTERIVLLITMTGSHLPEMGVMTIQNES